LASSALTDKRDWILSLFKPFVSDGMIKQHTHETTYFCFGGISQRLSIFATQVSEPGFTMVLTSRILVIAQCGRIHVFRKSA
jgi:hypothetical protein